MKDLPVPRSDPAGIRLLSCAAICRACRSGHDSTRPGFYYHDRGGYVPALPRRPCRGAHVSRTGSRARPTFGAPRAFAGNWSVLRTHHLETYNRLGHMDSAQRYQPRLPAGEGDDHGRHEGNWRIVFMWMPTARWDRLLCSSPEQHPDLRLDGQPTGFPTPGARDWTARRWPLPRPREVPAAPLTLDARPMVVVVGDRLANDTAACVAIWISRFPAARIYRSAPAIFSTLDEQRGGPAICTADDAEIRPRWPRGHRRRPGHRHPAHPDGRRSLSAHPGR